MTGSAFKRWELLSKRSLSLDILLYLNGEGVQGEGWDLPSAGVQGVADFFVLVLFRCRGSQVLPDGPQRAKAFSKGGLLGPPGGPLGANQWHFFGF